MERNPFNTDHENITSIDVLRNYLSGRATDSARVLATLDIAERFEVVALMTKGGGLAGRLAADRHRFPGGNFQNRTEYIFGVENSNRDRANQITRQIMERQQKDPEYADAIQFLTKEVIGRIDRESSALDVSAKAARIANNFKAIVEEICIESPASI